MENGQGIAKEAVAAEERLRRLEDWSRLLDELLVPVLAKKAVKGGVNGIPGV